MSRGKPETFREVPRILKEKEGKKTKITNLSRMELYLIFTFSILIVFFLGTVILYLITPEESERYAEIKKHYEVSGNFYGFLVSILFALFTYMTIQEIKRTREQENNPNLVVRLEPLGVGLTILRIKNVGGGPALNINLKYSMKRNNKVINESVWTHSLLQSTEFVRLIIEKMGIKKFYQEYDSVDFDITYFNSENKKIESKIKLDLKELLQGMEGVSWIWEKTTEDDIHSTSESLKEIKKSVDSIARGIGYLSHESKKKIDKEFIEKLEEREKKL